jgi:GNAT superfamily N-acetyltransferase
VRIDRFPRAWIAFSGGTPVGYVLIFERHRPQTPFCWERRWFDLDQICVLPAYRRRGIARALVDEAKRYAARSAAEMTVEAWAFNGSARATFEQLGFAPLSVRFRAPLS